MSVVQVSLMILGRLDGLSLCSAAQVLAPPSLQMLNFTLCWQVCTAWRDIVTANWSEEFWEQLARQVFPVYNWGEMRGPRQKARWLDMLREEGRQGGLRAGNWLEKLTVGAAKEETSWLDRLGIMLQHTTCLHCLHVTQAVHLHIPALTELQLDHFSHQKLRYNRLWKERLTSGLMEPEYPNIPINWQLYTWQGAFSGPVGSPYQGGQFLLSLEVPITYPFDPPVVRFITKIFHPNVNTHGDVGHDWVSRWSEATGITKGTSINIKGITSYGAPIYNFYKLATSPALSLMLMAG